MDKFLQYELFKALLLSHNYCSKVIEQKLKLLADKLGV